jgi:hypothetical protein
MIYRAFGNDLIYLYIYNVKGNNTNIDNEHIYDIIGSCILNARK